MFPVKLIKVRQHNYTAKEVKHYTSGSKFALKCALKIDRDEHREICLKLLSTYIRNNRWELLNTVMGYRIMLDGYGTFKQVIITDGGAIVKADVIYNRMLADEKAGIKFEETVV